MAEQTLNNPLSGLEVRKAILDRLELQMSRDCNLNANSAFDWFSADVVVKVNLHDAGVHVQSDFDVAAQAGTDPNGDYRAEATVFTMDAATPNEVRIESGQEVPVETKDEEGRKVVKGVKYARRGVR